MVDVIHANVQVRILAIGDKSETAKDVTNPDKKSRIDQFSYHVNIKWHFFTRYSCTNKI